MKNMLLFVIILITITGCVHKPETKATLTTSPYSGNTSESVIEKYNLNEDDYIICEFEEASKVIENLHASEYNEVIEKFNRLYSSVDDRSTPFTIYVKKDKSMIAISYADSKDNILFDVMALND